MKPQAIVFDMYGTVADLSAVTRACEELVADPAAFGALWRAKQLEYTFLLSLMENYQDFWSVTERALNYALEASNEQLKEKNRIRLMESWLHPEPFPDAAEELPRLKDRFPLAILSNGSPEMLDAGLQSAGLAGYFNWVISVAEVGRFKPSPNAYDLIRQHTGVAKEGVLFVSSNGFDVVGAGSYGLPTCWIRRAKKPLDPLGPVPDAVVADFSELQAWIG